MLRKMIVLLSTCFYNIYLNVVKSTFFKIYNLPFLRSSNISQLGSKLGQKLTTFSKFWTPAATELQFSRVKQNRDFFLYKYFYKIRFLYKIHFQSSSSYCHKKWITHYSEKHGHGFVQQPVRNVYAKFKVHPLSRFRTGTGQVLTTQKHWGI